MATSSVQLSGKIGAGTEVPTGSVTISAGGATATASINPTTGSFTVDLPTGSLAPSATPYPVAYNYAAAGDFNAAQDSSTSITVAKAQLTVTASNASRASGAANPAFTDTITGFVNGQTLATSGVSGSPSLGTTANASSPAGTYPITPSTGTLAATNYDFTFANGTLTVNAQVPPTPTSLVLEPADQPPRRSCHRRFAYGHGDRDGRGRGTSRRRLQHAPATRQFRPKCDRQPQWDFHGHLDQRALRNLLGACRRCRPECSSASGAPTGLPPSVSPTSHHQLPPTWR